MDEHSEVGQVAAEGDPQMGPEQLSPEAQRKNAIAIFGVVMLFLVAIVAFAFAPRGNPTDGILPNDPSGYPMPELSLERLDGTGELSLQDYVGQPLVINFWGAWCVTCKEEAAFLAAAEKKWREQGVVFIGVDSKDTKDAAQAFEKEYGFEYPSIVDPEGSVGISWGITGYPETFFIGKDGRIASKFIGSFTDAETLDMFIASIAN
jgi:cytochrome c biogenesis protein CcmG/thiol:disulfide interchange protein DsbE